MKKTNAVSGSVNYPFYTGEQDMDEQFFVIVLSFLSGIIASLIAAFITFLCRQVINNFRNKSEYSGTWLFQIYDEKMNVIQKDLLFFKHDIKTGIICGDTSKTFPQKKSWKKRSVIGVLLLGRLLTISYTYEPIQSMSATHSVLIEDYHFRGFILRYIMQDNKIVTNNIDITKLGNKKPHHYSKHGSGKDTKSPL